MSNKQYEHSLIASVTITKAPADGEPGAPGQVGLSIIREDWVEGREYRNDTDVIADVRYLYWVHLPEDPADVWYVAKPAHNGVLSSDGNRPAGAASQYWDKANIQAPIYTPSLFARAITADQIDVESVRVKMIEAGLIRADEIDVDNLYVKALAAVVGTIGGFRISGQGLTNSNEDGTFTNDAYIVFRNDLYNIFAGFGTNVSPANSSARSVIRAENGRASSVYDNIGLYASASNGYRNHAVYIASGMLTGLSFNTRQITASRTLNHEDGYISCYNTINMNITLPSPSDSQLGKVYYIRRMNDANVTLLGKIHADGEVSAIGVGKGRGDTAMLVNDGQFWCYNYMIR